MILTVFSGEKSSIKVEHNIDLQYLFIILKKIINYEGCVTNIKTSPNG